MIKRKIITSFALGMCLMTLSAGGTVFAAGANNDSASQEVNVYKIAAEENATEEIATEEVAIEPILVNLDDSSDDEGLIKKQSEIDQFVFVDHVDELAKLGVKVTNTGIINDSIEIGITPYTEEAANFLYEKLGNDSIQVIEGLKAELYMTTVATNPDAQVTEPESYVGEGVVLEEDEMGITSMEETEEVAYDPIIAESSIVNTKTEEKGSNALLIALGAGVGVVLLGGAIILTRKKKMN